MIPVLEETFPTTIMPARKIQELSSSCQTVVQTACLPPEHLYYPINIKTLTEEKLILFIITCFLVTKHDSLCMNVPNLYL